MTVTGVLVNSLVGTLVSNYTKSLVYQPPEQCNVAKKNSSELINDFMYRQHVPLQYSFNILWTTM